MKQKEKTSSVDAIEDLAEALRKVFLNYSKTTRKKAWDKIQSSKGKKEIEKIINYPQSSIKGVRNLWGESTDFLNWL